VSLSKHNNSYPETDGRLGTHIPIKWYQRLRYTVRFALPPSLFSLSSHSPQSALVVASTSRFVFPYPITIAFILLHDLVSESEVLNLFHPQFIDPYIHCYPIDQTLTATLLEILILRSLQKIVITLASGLEIGQTFFFTDIYRKFSIHW